ncbi:hypothetical protein [Nocardia cyriacigeorgica]|uniref:hypothetical protein n=1 Tax=Nocardia cyriacigeorgica TaxID=135487 RepID=UPI002454FB02|nr:hypothetical protein [Nocardia cyriacigeorgica]
MRNDPTALGYLRRDISGARQSWDEIRLRSLAKRYGYNLRKTIVFGPSVAEPLERLVAVASGLAVDAVFVPSVDHFGGDVPAALVRITDVITVDDERTYARWSTGQLPGGVG